MAVAVIPDAHFGGGNCAVCFEPIPGGRLMCRRHWFAVPAPLRREVTECLAEYMDGEVVVQDLRAAQHQAIAAVRT